jgi:hypothetical protein
MPDSIPHTIMRTDSLSKDSLTIVPDSARMDSLKTIVSDTRHEGIALKNNPEHNNWVFSILLIFFLIFVYAINKSYNWLTDGITNFFKIRSRNSLFTKTSLLDYPSRILLVFITTGLFTLYLYLHFNNSDNFDITHYLIFLGIGTAFIILKKLIIDIAGYIFFEPEITRNANESYFNLYIFNGLLFFPVIVGSIYTDNYQDVNTFDKIALILVVLWFILMTFKLFQIFYHKILDFFYIMLYLCTLEILPAFGIFHTLELIINKLLT